MYLKQSKMFVKVFAETNFSTHQWSLSCGDSWTSDMLWRLQTVSMLGRMQVLIMRASMWTATRSVVQTENAMSIPIGTFVLLSSCTSTIATWRLGTLLHQLICSNYSTIGDKKRMKLHCLVAAFTVCTINLSARRATSTMEFNSVPRRI